jgi:hypothetical protein
MLDILQHADYLAEDRLLLALYKLGMANRRHLSYLLGWTENTVGWRVHKIRSARGKTPEEKDEWIVSYSPSHRDKKHLYYLGSKGMDYCVRVLNQPKKKPVSQGQWAHYEGLLDIYMRLIDRNGKEGLKWLTTHEATDYLFRMYKLENAEEWRKNPKLEKETRKRLIRPDALLAVNGNTFWIEFDNSTETSSQLEEKMEQYIKVLTDLEDPSPVVWVVKDYWRKTDLQFIWGYTSKGYPTVPKMEFFVQGEEVNFLLS